MGANNINNVANLESQTVFLQAIDKHSIVIAASEFEGLNFKDRSLNLVLRDQFPKGIGLRERKVGRAHQYIELNFDNEEDKMEALNKGFLILGRKIKVQAMMDKNSDVTRIGITNISYEKDDKLRPLMIQLFEKYGSILEIGLHHTVGDGWFNGKGHVTLVKDKTKNYEPLTPRIPSWEQDHYLPETEQHMLFTCIQKQDLWNSAFKKYLSNPKDPNYSSIFEDLSTLRLFKYYILHYHDKFIIYDFFATVIRFIWKVHWKQFFEETPVVDEIVINQIQKELLKLSAYNSLC
ncbi:hypothetical protein G6F43_008299 [Rhizopus delemar]|nr:hypothetical protein G6F43_008299 [Rhizopus delemar]